MSGHRALILTSMLSKGKTLLLGALFCTELFAGGNKRSQATFIDPKVVPAPPATSTAPLMDTQAFKELARIYQEAEAKIFNIGDKVSYRLVFDLGSDHVR